VGSQLVMNALTRALKDRGMEELQGLIHHSDQGVQYAAKGYVGCLKNHNIRISMSRKGKPYDNAFEDAFRNIRHFSDNRLHSVLGCRSPGQVELEVALNTID
jgi:putative transposase